MKTGFRVLARAAMLAVVIGVLGAPAGASAQQQIMITPDSKLLDEHGEQIGYSDFMKKMETGAFMPQPVMEDGKVVAYRLAPRPAGAGGDDARRRMKVRRINSSPIDGPVVIDTVSHHYLFAPIGVYNGEEWFHYYVIFDTGTFVPVILLPEFMEEIGKVEKVRVGGVEITGPPTGSYGMPDGIRNMNRFRTEAPEKFEDRTIAGIIGASLFENYLVSIDSRSGRVTLRPLDSAQRTLHPEAPIAATTYRTDARNIWFPVTINGVEGFAHYDTGNPNFMYIVENVLNKGAGAVQSFVVGDGDLAPEFGEIEPRAEKDLVPRYGDLAGEMNLLVNFGNRATDNLVVTIDPRDKMLYFERRND